MGICGLSPDPKDLKIDLSPDPKDLKILPGDKVKVELTPYRLDKGRSISSWVGDSFLVIPFLITTKLITLIFLML